MQLSAALEDEEKELAAEIEELQADVKEAHQEERQNRADANAKAEHVRFTAGAVSNPP